MKYENIVRCQFSSKKNTPMHFHQDIEILYVLEGSLVVEFETANVHLNTDDFLLINSNMRHAIKGKSDLLIGSVMIDYTMLTEIFSGEQLFFLCNSAEEDMGSYAKMRNYIRQIFNYYQASEGQGIILKNSIYYQLLYLITSEFIVKKGMKKYEGLRGIRDERMNDILNYLVSNYNEQLTLKELAERQYLSVPYLSKYIKKNFGMSFLKLLNNIRLERAVGELLYTDKTVLKIAMDNGFPNLAGFNHAFRESYQMSPTEYRQEMQEKFRLTDEQENDEEIMERVGNYLAENHVNAPEAREASFTLLEVDARNHVPFSPKWHRLINVGNAYDLLNYNVRNQVQYLKEQLGFEYMRIWNVFTQQMMICLDEKNSVYGFGCIDQVFDFMRSIRVKPHIELGIKDDGIFDKVDQGILQFKNDSRITLLDKNETFLKDFICHLCARYGQNEVSEWYFELEKNSVIKEEVGNEKYLDIFEKVAGIFRNYVPNVKIGGAGFTMNRKEGEMEELLKAWKKRRQQPDFISIYCFPYLRDEELLDAGRNPYSPDEDFVYNRIQRTKEVMGECGYGDTELIVSEWSMTLSNRNCLNDGIFKAAYVMKNLIQNVDWNVPIGYWLATDVYSERFAANNVLFGGCGLLSKDGIRKPAFFAYESLRFISDDLFGKNENALVTGNGRGLYFIVCHNYKHFNFRYYSLNEDEISVEQQQRLLQDQESLHLVFRFNNVNNGMYKIKVFYANRENGNVQHEWERLDHIENPTPEELVYLKTKCQTALDIYRAEARNNTLEIETHLSALEIQGIVVAEITA